MKSKKLLCEHQALSSSNLFRICLALKIASCCILQTGQGDGVFGLEADASNISFESIKCWQLEHDLIYFEFSSLCVSIHKTYEFSHLDKLLEIHAWESGGARILFVGITSYLNQWSSKDKFLPNALGLSASKLLISAHDFSSYYQSSFHVMWYQASKQ